MQSFTKSDIADALCHVTQYDEASVRVSELVSAARNEFNPKACNCSLLNDRGRLAELWPRSKYVKKVDTCLPADAACVNSVYETMGEAREACSKEIRQGCRFSFIHQMGVSSEVVDRHWNYGVTVSTLEQAANPYSRSGSDDDLTVIHVLFDSFQVPSTPNAREEVEVSLVVR